MATESGKLRVELTTRQRPDRNPGPPWGYRLLGLGDRILPTAIADPALYAGSALAVSVMPAQRAASAEYLRIVLDRTPARSDINRHFYAFSRSLMAKLRLARGIRPAVYYADRRASEPFDTLCRSPEPALFGTFHIGHSDLIGCMLSDFDRKIALVRHRLGNSIDTDFMSRAFSPSVRFLWINRAEDFLFDLKNAIEQNISVGLQCDRVEFGGRIESFQFLGKRRLFPFTIYHLATLFERPVVFAFAGPEDPEGNIPVITSAVFRPADHKDPLAAARTHFQEVLSVLEDHLREHPYLWFNFTPLNPEARP